MHVGVAILRVPEGLDYSAILGDSDLQNQSADAVSLGPSIAETPPGTPDVGRHNTGINDSPLGEIKETKPDPKKNKKAKKGPDWRLITNRTIIQ